jgi:hypothetical protein
VLHDDAITVVTTARFPLEKMLNLSSKNLHPLLITMKFCRIDEVGEDTRCVGHSRLFQTAYVDIY